MVVKCGLLGGSECESRGDNPLDSGIVGEVHEEHNILHRAVLLEISPEETRDLHIDSHSGEHDSEVLAGVIEGVLSGDERRLPANLSTDLIMGKTVSREKRDLLTTSNRVHDIDG